MAVTTKVSVIEQCQISPQPSSVSETSLPLTFIDMLMINSWPANSLYFYECSFSKSHFMDTIIPKLKNSLAQTLNHFFILAGKLVIPNLDSDKKPEFVYNDGDSVSLTFSESCSVELFYDLAGNHARNCSEFRLLATERPPPYVDASGSTISPLLTLQVTLFPETGICIGLNAHHVVVDGSSVRAFLQAWAYLSQLDEISTSSLPSELMPLYDRSVMKETDELRDIFWNQMKSNKKPEADNQESAPPPPIAPIENELVQETFVLGKNDVQKLKSFVITGLSLPHISTFTVICAYIWKCIATTHATGAIVDPDEEDPVYLFAFSADARGRSKPRIPVNYFGNCIAFCGTTANASQLKGDNGLLVAAELIAETIHERLQNEEGIFKGAEEWIPSGRYLNNSSGYLDPLELIFYVWILDGGRLKRLNWC
ncbi:hypothetical protein Leryth_002692 [Lithospermum erythrorhizon]|nr:hypothetical protein Leryth_002692 [Lithospermum erythrorhizon]